LYWSRLISASAAANPATVRVYETVDARLTFGDFLAQLRRQARTAQPVSKPAVR
jgi:hypothetical protein